MFRSMHICFLRNHWDGCSCVKLHGNISSIAYSWVILFYVSNRFSISVAGLDIRCSHFRHTFAMCPLCSQKWHSVSLKRQVCGVWSPPQRKQGLAVFPFFRLKLWIGRFFSLERAPLNEFTLTAPTAGEFLKLSTAPCHVNFFSVSIFFCTALLFNPHTNLSRRACSRNSANSQRSAFCFKIAA